MDAYTWQGLDERSKTIDKLILKEKDNEVKEILKAELNYIIVQREYLIKYGKIPALTK